MIVTNHIYTGADVLTGVINDPALIGAYVEAEWKHIGPGLSDPDYPALTTETGVVVREEEEGRVFLDVNGYLLNSKDGNDTLPHEGAMRRLISIRVIDSERYTKLANAQAVRSGDGGIWVWADGEYVGSDGNGFHASFASLDDLIEMHGPLSVLVDEDGEVVAK